MLLVATALWFFSFGTLAAARSISHPCDNVTPNTKVCDPATAGRHFFLCADTGIKYRFVCPSDLVFDNDQQACEWDYNNPCTGVDGGIVSESAITTTTAAAATTITTSVADAGAGDVAGVSRITVEVRGQELTASPSLTPPSSSHPCDTVTPNTKVCDPSTGGRHYFLCGDNGIKHRFLCPTDLVFDDNKQVCKWDYKRPCTADSNAPEPATTTSTTATIAPGAAAVAGDSRGKVKVGGQELTAWVTSLSLAPRSGSHPCDTATPNTKVCDPSTGGRHYFLCGDDGVKYRILCPTDLVFDDEKQVCTWDYKRRCTADSNATQPATTTSTTTTTTTVASGAVGAGVSRSRVKVRGQKTTTLVSSSLTPRYRSHPCHNTTPNTKVCDPATDGRRYFLCGGGGVTYEFICPANLVFNGNRQVCDSGYSTPCIADGGVAPEPVGTTSITAAAAGAAPAAAAAAAAADDPRGRGKAPGKQITAVVTSSRVPRSTSHHPCDTAAPNTKVCDPATGGHHYFLCRGKGVQYEFVCPTDLVFDNERQACEWGHKTRCRARSPAPEPATTTSKATVAVAAAVAAAPVPAAFMGISLTAGGQKMIALYYILIINYHVLLFFFR